ncbi:MAG: FAD-dependent oxidoreductase, partial [Hyphomicrobiaceae bacterium]
MQNKATHAIVVGAGMAGLVAARVLADRYDRVTLIERDALPIGPEWRKGVPQGRHPHALLGRGREVLEELFPGLTQELIDRGAVTGDISA